MSRTTTRYAKPSAGCPMQADLASPAGSSGRDRRLGVGGLVSGGGGYAGRSSVAGLTLVELLVVVTILVILTAFAVPVLTPSLESRRIREAARQVNVYLSLARNRAMEKNRPVGVWFQRRTGQNQAVTTLFLAEEPPPYAGEELNTRIIITPGSGNTAQVAFVPSENPVGAGLVQVGDRIQLNFQGPIWQITGIAGNTWTFSLLSPSGTPTPRTPATGLPFQIFRRPRPSLAAPLNLPTTLAVDTRWSGAGVGALATAFAPAHDTDTNPIILMFSPKGEVHSVWYSGGSAVPMETLFLLIGRVNRIPTNLGGASPAEDGLYNWQDLGNLWITITPQTGMIKTVEVASGADVAASRRIALSGQSMGGK